MTSSLSRNFFLGLGLASLISTIAATLIAYGAFKHELEARQIDFLNQYVQERTSNVDHRFSTLTTLQHSAVRELRRRMGLLTPAQVDATLDRLYPRLADGTRRSRPELFDGEVDGEGRLTYGVGAFIAPNRALPMAQKRALVAAFDLVSEFGQAAHGDYHTFYFYTPWNQVVMFGPDRPDRLMFYRHDAPADLDFSHEEMDQIVTPSADPGGQTRCTSLQRLVQDKTGDRVGTACLTPVDVDGRLVGAFGSTLNLTQFLAQAIGDTLPGAKSLIIRQDGSLIAYPGFAKPGVASERTVDGYERRLRLKALGREAAAAGRPSGVFTSPDRKQIIAYGRIDGPGWYLLLTYPAALIASSAARSASWILLLGLALSALQTTAVLWLARRAIVRPLHLLARSCNPGAAGAGHAMVAWLERRRDEIGVLARALLAERRRADELLTSLEQRVLDRTAELERANDEKSRFLANMSHELRTPLNGVIAISETLAREQTSPRNIELAELIIASGRLLEQVLTDILDFSKIEAGEMRLEAEPFRLQTVVSRVAELHRASADAKGVALTWRIAPEADGWRRGDAVRLAQVLSNLLSNAVKFTEAGTVELTVDAGPAGATRFQVADTGIGFDETVKARLFQRFEQADVSIRRRFGGTGLGLAICRSLVELMGGEIQAQSAPGRGARFTFDLPLPREAEPLEVVRQDEAAPEMGALRVLLAEDHPTNQRVIQLILDAAGVELVIVDDGQAALDRLAVERFDVVLMDMQMPVMDGLSATTALRAHEAAAGQPRTPVLMLTANALDEHARASFDAGADRHLAKPIRAMELLGAIAAVVEAAAQAEAEAGTWAEAAA